MPDITMCQNWECPLGLSCKRLMGKPSEYQSYAMFEPVDGVCQYYWEVEKYESR